MKSRKIQNKVKHEILEEYLARWGGIILNGLRGPFQKAQAGTFGARFVYVDCFAFEGCYEENGKVVYGSPIIGIKALEKHQQLATDIGFHLKSIAILIEQESSTYQTLLETLRQQGFGNRIVELHHPSELGSACDGQIVMVNDNQNNYTQSLLAFAEQDNHTWSFYFLDTYGPQGIPLTTVGPIISQKRTEAIINFPVSDVYRKRPSALRSTPEHVHHIQYINKMYGTDTWPCVDEGLDKSGVEQALVNCYVSQLQKQDNDLAIKVIPLRFEEMEKTGYYLCLTTHDGTGGLAMNEILDDARIKEYDYRTKRRITVGGQLPMPFLDQVADHRRPVIEDADIGAVAAQILGCCQGKTLCYREVLRRMVDSPYYPRDIEDAMGYLKKQKHAVYEGSIRNSTLVMFK